jgi:hypothetical protein
MQIRMSGGPGLQSLEIRAGPRARQLLLERGLRPQDVRVVPGAAGGPKGLVLNPLDRWLFGHWLAEAPQVLHLPGASIGAWRLACACMPDADAALGQLAEDYITERYEHEPGRPPTADVVSAAFGAMLRKRLGDHAAEVLSHPRRRLHVLTSRGRHLLAREGRWRTPLGYAGAFVANAVSRQALGGWLERVVFSDPRDALPFGLDDFRGRRVALDAANFVPALRASCAIPFLMHAVHDIPGAPRGAYWDGGITDYHLHLPYGRMDEGLVLYPHFQPTVVPGWLDKAWKTRHRATPALDNLVLLSPSPQWVATLPGAKLPDRSDFKAWGEDTEGRMRAWRLALAESERLVEEFAARVEGGRSVQALPLD